MIILSYKIKRACMLDVARPLDTIVYHITLYTGSISNGYGMGNSYPTPIISLIMNTNLSILN